MRKTKFILSLIIFSVLSSCYFINSKNNHEGLNVTSSKNIETIKFNKIIKQAHGEGKAWVLSPELYPFYLLKLTEVKSYKINYKAKSAENNDEFTLLIMRDGFLDDSVRGDLHSFSLAKKNDYWLVKNLTRSIRCWRSKPDEYHSEQCG